MNIECSVALNLLSIIYMLILLFNLRHKCKWDSLNRQYCQILTAVCLFLGLDILYLLFYEKTDPVSQVLLNTVNNINLKSIASFTPLFCVSILLR